MPAAARYRSCCVTLLAADATACCSEHANSIESLQSEVADLKDELAGARNELTATCSEHATSIKSLRCEAADLKAELRKVLQVAGALTKLVTSMIHGPASSAGSGSFVPLTLP